MKTLMIHNIVEDMFNLPLEDYRLTFDDGTADHYEYYPRFKNINTTKIYFVISSYIGKTGYLNINEIKELMKDPQVVIGGHSYSHTKLESIDNFVDKVTHIQKDTELMIEWFQDVLGFNPTTFCFPYNNDLKGIYTSLVKNKGITEFFGHERIPIETLLHT
jgi:peptidoglycan/xylan/chitin deacetylase (PgdA/CDA1 family)